MKTNIDSNVNPFKISENYFSDLEKSILSKTVGNNKTDNPFITPDFYFENLEESILVKTIESNKIKKGKVIPLFTKKLYMISAAACVLFMVLLGVYFIYNQDKENTMPLITNRDTGTKMIKDSSLIGNEIKKESSDIEVHNVNKDMYVSYSAKSSKNQHIKNKSYKSQKENIYQQEAKSSNVIYDLYFNPDDDNSLSEEEIFAEEFLLL